MRPATGMAILMLVVLSALLPANASMQLPQQPYNARDWNLAWQAFMNAGDMRDAYALALSAVKAHPTSLRWRKRLAHAALMTQHPETALKAYYSLVTDGHRAYFKQALALAIGLDDANRATHLLTAALREQPYSKQRWIQAIGDLRSLNRPDTALRLLRQADRRHPRRFFLWQQVVLYHSLAEPRHELAVLKRYRKRYGPQPRAMLQTATLLYVHGKITAAYRALQAARSRASPQNIIYWRTLAELAWLLQDYAVAEQASQILYVHHQANTGDLQRLVFLNQSAHPHRAFLFAAVGWRRYRDPQFFLDMLAAASALNSNRLLERAFAQVEPADRPGLAVHAFYWTSRAQWLLLRGKSRAAAVAYRHALALRPGDPDLMANYLWFLVDTREVSALRPLLPRLTERAGRIPALWSPLAAAYALLDQPARALAWLRAAWPRHHKDPLWLMGYADTLAQDDRQRAAYGVRRHALQLLTHHPAPNPTQARRDRKQIVRLASLLAPGNSAARLTRTLAAHPGNPRSRGIVLAWALSQSAYPLARWWWLKAYRKHPPTAGTRLSVALGTDNGTQAGRLLRNHASILPRRDRVDAADRLGWHTLATTLAFRGLAGAPDDRRLQRQFREDALAAADSFDTTLRGMRSNGLARLGLNLDTRLWVSPRMAIGAHVAHARQRVYDTGLLGATPGQSSHAELDLTRLSARGRLDFSVGGGSNLRHYAQAGISWHQRWSGGLTTIASANYGVRPQASIPLYIGALEDRVDVAASYSLTPRNNLDGRLRLGRYRAQGGGSLGELAGFAADLTHQVWQSHPNYTLIATLSGAIYRPAARLPSQLRPLVPSTVPATVGFFVPRDFLQGCFGAAVNLRFAEDYTTRLRPIAAASGCYNSAYGLGYVLEGGLALPLFGHDHLALDLRLEGGQFGVTGRSESIMLRYRYYFSP